jgi:hypothetical protein
MYCIEKPSPPRFTRKTPGPPSGPLMLSPEYLTAFATLFPLQNLALRVV